MKKRTTSLAAIAGLGASLLFTGASLPSDAAPPAPLVQVTTTSDTVDTDPGDGRCRDAAGRCSLRAAVQESNADPGHDRIRLMKGAVYRLTLDGAGEDGSATGDLDVASHLSIRGNGATVDAAGIDRAFDVRNLHLYVQDLTVSGGAPPSGESGGGFRNHDRLTLRATTVADNHVTGTGASGGAVLNDDGRLVVRDSTFSGNSATRAGGAVEAVAGHTTITGSTLSDNSTGAEPGNGGGLHLTDTGTVAVTSSRIVGNVAAAEGGGLWNSSTGTMHVTTTYVTGNAASGAAADEGGGGIFNDGGVLHVRGSWLANNEAGGLSGSGGGLFNNAGRVELRSSAVTTGTAQRAGGGIEALAGTTILHDVKLLANTAGPNPGNGGGLHLTGAGRVEVHRGTVEGNRASAEGGGLWNSAEGTMLVVDGHVSANQASGAAPDQGGGGIFNDGGTLRVTRGRLQANIADGEAGSGGGILNNLGTLHVQGTVIATNRATRAGGGIEANVGTTRLQGVALASNATGANPGNGGGLHLTGAGTVDVVSGRITANRAAAEGGGLWNSDTGTMRVRGTAIRGNSAPVGPNVFNDGGTFTIDGTPVPT
jgi:CSLREA domain-containing protein